MPTRTFVSFWTATILVAAICFRAFAEPPIHGAAWAGDTDRIKSLLDADPSQIGARNSEQETPLHRASDGGQARAVELLLQRGADVNSKAYNMFTPLHLAANGEVAKALIKGGADVNQKDAWGKTPLQMAVQSRKVDVVDSMIEAGCPLDLPSALLLGKRDLVRDMLKKDPGLVAGTGDGSDLWGNTTPLGIAASQGDVEMVRMFLELGANVNGGTFMPNAGGTATPLCNAVWSKNVQIVQLLFDHGATWEGAGGKFYDSIFHFAVQNSEPRVIQLFLEHGAKIEKTWPSGVPRECMLSVAAKAGGVERVRLILEHGQGVFTIQDQQIAMLDAADASHADVVTFLRARGAPYDLVVATILDDHEGFNAILQTDSSLINTRDDRFGRPVLTWAIKHHREELATRLVELGADINARTIRQEYYGTVMHFGPVTAKDRESPRSSGETPLLVAIQQDDAPIVKRLLEAGAEVSVPDLEMRTPLHAAVAGSNVESVKDLIAHGADVNAKDDRGTTPLHLAAQSSEIAELLIQAGAETDIENQFGATPLDWSVGGKDPGTAALLVSHGAKLKLGAALIVGNVDAVRSLVEADPGVVNRPISDDTIETPLIIAALHGHADLVALLIQHGATVNYSDNRRTTPLHAAAEGGSTEVVQILLDHGADMKASSYQGTALHRAAMFGQLGVVQLLLDRGAKVNEEAQGGGWTPLHAVASWSDNADVAAYLIDHGAEVNHRSTRDGLAPLHATTLRGGVNVARILVGRGANVNAKDGRGETALRQVKRPNVYETEDATILTKRAQLVELLTANGGVE